jgi:O-antigen/teichoic acid export membrane protein
VSVASAESSPDKPARAKALLRRALVPALSFGDQAFSSVCNFLTTILLARSLGLETFGLYAMIWVSVYLAMSLQLGLIVSPMMSIGSKETGRAADAYFTVMLVHQALYVTAAAAVIFGILIVMAGSTRQLAGVGLPAAIAAATYLSQDFLRRYLFARRRPSAVLAIDIVNQGLKLGALALLWQAGLMSIHNALWAGAGAAAVSTLGGLFLSGPHRWQRAMFRDATARQWRSARWLVLTATGQWVVGYSGVLVTAGLFGPKIVGALRATQSLLAMMNVIREALENILPPLAGKALTEAGLAGLRRTLGLALLFSAVIGGVSVLGFAAFGPWLLHQLYGGEMREFDWLIVWYSLIFPMALVNIVQGCAFRAQERTRSIFFATLAAACFNILAIYPSGLMFGVAGIIAIAVLTELITLIVLALLGREFWSPEDRPAAFGDGAAIARSP